MSAQLLAPVFVLIVWTLVMLTWMVFQRFPAVRKAGIDITARPGGRGQDLDKVMPGKGNWAAHNYVHLLEQPTIFYATVIGLAVLGLGTPTNVALAWTYVGLRIVHSIWQATVNTIRVRASLFFVSTFILLALAVNGLCAALSA